MLAIISARAFAVKPQGISQALSVFLNRVWQADETFLDRQTRFMRDFLAHVSIIRNVDDLPGCL